jgi:prepilin-type processing-associated H-X9-DG protein
MKQLGLAILNYESQTGSLPMGGITYKENPVDCTIANRTFSLFDLILPQMEQSAIYNAANFSHAAGGADGSTEGGANGGAINHTAFSTKVASYVCPSDSQQTPYVYPTQSLNGYNQTSYGGSFGTYDIFHWYCGCPPGPPYGGSCPSANDVEIHSDGAFLKDYTIRLQSITDGLSNTIFAGEASRYNGDQDSVMNFYSRVGWWGSAWVDPVGGNPSSRPTVLFSTVPRINAPFQPGDQTYYPGQISATGDVNSWLFVSSPDYCQLGQFGFRSFHPGGANFLMGDGSCRFLKQTIDMGSPVLANKAIGVYRQLSTIAGGEVISSDGY